MVEKREELRESGRINNGLFSLLFDYIIKVFPSRESKSHTFLGR